MNMTTQLSMTGKEQVTVALRGGKPEDSGTRPVAPSPARARERFTRMNNAFRNTLGDHESVQ